MSQRKADHIGVCLNKDVEYRKTTGLEKISFVPSRIPDIDKSEIDTSVRLFGKKLSAPIIIEAISGGNRSSTKLNKDLAKTAQEYGIAMGVGSQRIMIEDESFIDTYIVRDVAPDILFFGNIGIAQLKEYGPEDILSAAEKIGADAICVHLNSTQEAVQQEGDIDFSGCADKLKSFCRQSKMPVVAKEVGFGISGKKALQLEKLGVDAIDVAGAGGTSWTKVEYFRSGTWGSFDEWGLPTYESLVQVKKAVKIPVFASGGIRTGLDIAKSIALGAEAAGMALPFLRKWKQGMLKEFTSSLIDELRTAMFLNSCSKLSELRKAELSGV